MMLGSLGAPIGGSSRLGQLGLRSRGSRAGAAAAGGAVAAAAPSPGVRRWIGRRLARGWVVRRSGKKPAGGRGKVVGHRDLSCSIAALMSGAARPGSKAGRRSKGARSSPTTSQPAARTLA